MMEACLRTFWGIAIENRENDHKDHAKDHKTRQRKSPIWLRGKIQQLQQGTI